MVDVMKSEPIGKDNLTDLLWLELKAPDYAGHAWNMLRPEQGDVLLEADRQIARVKHVLDTKVGRGNYVLAISADHGQQPLPDLYGGWRINSQELQKDIDARFGHIVEKITPVDIYFDHDALEKSGYSFDDVARYLGTYTLGDNIPAGIPGAERVPQDRLDESLFAGAFSENYIQSLTPATIEGFGPSKYPEGDLELSPATASPSP
jgi:hypothetical protein